VQREPHLPLARALLALANTHAAESAAPAERERLRAEAQAQAERARRNDPTIGESYLALERLQARNAWDARENLLQQGITRAQRNAALNSEYSGLLLEVGRFTDALAYARNASTLDPLSPARRNAVANVLLMSGDANGAREIADDLERAWPNDPSVWLTQTRIALWSARYDDALAKLSSPASEVRSVGAQLCWRDAAALMRRAEAGGVRRVVACARSGDLPPGQTIMTLASAGALDEAFALARTRFVDEHRAGLDVVFAPATRAMRADPRFMPLMKDVGLLRYWDLGNRWPDFCAEPGLHYRCQAEAARLLRGS
jgi:tetratricopeptide (TPR) repeat protein